MSQSPVRESISAVLLTQGERRFYTVAMESGLLSETCVATSRNQDPLEGFQRTLSEKRALSIARYIEQGGVIPGSIVLSAQSRANLVYTHRTKTLQFDAVPGAFLILDGQHRVFGFALSKEKRLRVPVVIFFDLNKRDEARLFIDINTLQKSVPNELLLDIKKLAETETEVETNSNFIFDYYDSNSRFYLNGLLSPREKIPNKITRATFHLALKPLIIQYSSQPIEKFLEIFDAYLRGFGAVVPFNLDDRKLVTKPVMFKAIAALFPAVAKTVALKNNRDYTAGNFEDVLRPVATLRKTTFTNLPPGFRDLAATFAKCLDQSNVEL